MSGERRGGFIGIKRVLAGKPEFEGAYIKGRLEQTWPKVLASFFEGCENKTKVLDFKQGVLTVACLSRDLAFRIKALAAAIIELLNRLMERVVVYSLRLEF